MIKKGAEVTFEPTTNTKGLSAFAVKVAIESKYIFIANERIKLTSIKSFNTFTKEVPAQAEVDKANTILSVNLLMNKISHRRGHFRENHTTENAVDNNIPKCDIHIF